jgi:hypothetical protein
MDGQFEGRSFPLTAEKRREIIERLRSALADIEYVQIAYLFGSVARGASNVRDVDVGIVVAQPKLQNRFRIMEHTRSRLSKATEPIPVDVVILNDAPLLLRHEVFKERMVLHCVDEDERIEFEARSECMYFDMEPIRELFWEAILNRVRTGRFGYSE